MAHVNARGHVGVGSLFPECDWCQVVGLRAGAFMYGNISPAQDWELVGFFF